MKKLLLSSLLIAAIAGTTYAQDGDSTMSKMSSKGKSAHGKMKSHAKHGKMHSKAKMKAGSNTESTSGGTTNQ